MKNTLLTLMLVSSLFVISCGADSTKPTDAFKSQKTEISSGTKEAANLQITATGTVDVSSFALPGEKVTEIVEATVDGAVVKAPASTKNTDGGIYQFTVTGTTVTSVTYKYTKSIIAPIVTRTSIESASYGSVTMTDPLFIFEPNVISVTDSYGDNIPFIYNGGNIITLETSINGSVTVEYQYMDINSISEKPTKEATIESTGIITLTANDAGKTYVCKVYQNTMTPQYFYGIVPADGIIPSTSLVGVQQNDSYTLWVY